MRMPFTPPIPWHTLLLIAAGLAWLVRAGLGLYRPAYWSPRTPLDYAAVVGTSAALILTALSVWGFYHQHPAPPSRAQTGWRVGVGLTCAAALTVGVSNFVEDALGFKSLGSVWVIGSLVLAAGLLSAGLSALWVPGFSRWVGGLFLLALLGLLFTEAHGQFGVGLAWLALGFVRGKSL